MIVNIIFSAVAELNEMSKIQDFPESYSLIPLTPILSHDIPSSPEKFPRLNGCVLGRAQPGPRARSGVIGAASGKTVTGRKTRPMGQGASSKRHGSVHRHLREQDRPQGPRVRAGDF